MNIQRFSYLANCGNGRQIGLRNQFKALPISGSNLGPLGRLFLRHVTLFPVFSDVGGNYDFNLHNRVIMKEITSGEHSPGGSVPKGSEAK